uniref:Uncharacterized protein n=1 Tax=Heterorhabditis bacteriophora TaxID=37862 RepID=A0A1I7WE43_HETBA
MASYASSVEDPEKHFLGNLLDDDASFSTSNRRDSPTVLNSIPAVSVINGVGSINIGGPTPTQSFWPEPPPPYTPAIQTSQCFGTYSHQKNSQIPLSNLLQIGMNLPKYIAQPQIHHHHHNLHHHTHTNNTVENHYYDVHNALPDFLDGPMFSPNLKNLINVKTGEWCENSHVTQVPAAINKLHHSTPSVAAQKMPFSYRDVAARNDTQTFSDIKPTQQRTIDSGIKDSKKLPEKERKRKYAGSPTNTTTLPTSDQNGKVDVLTKYDVLQKLNSPTFKNMTEIQGVEEVLLKHKDKVYLKQIYVSNVVKCMYITLQNHLVQLRYYDQDQIQ